MSGDHVAGPSTERENLIGVYDVCIMGRDWGMGGVRGCEGCGCNERGVRMTPANELRVQVAEKEAEEPERGHKDDSCLCKVIAWTRVARLVFFRSSPSNHRGLSPSPY
jgi:hypothetical protein